jgi:Bacterial membrane protein YfhO
MFARRDRLIGPLVLLLLTIGVNWKILLTSQYAAFDSPDFAYQVAPWLQVQAVELHKHHWPLLWDPYIMGGHPLLGQAQPGVVSPLNWLLYAVPLQHGFIRTAAIHWYMAMIRFIAALAMYALCRDLKRSRAASIFAGAAFAFAGYVGTTGWPQMLNGAILAPLVIMFSLRALRGERAWLNAALSGGMLGLSWLSGHHQIPIYVTLAVSGIWLFEICRKQAMPARAAKAGLLVTLMIVMFMAGAAQTLPAYSYGADVFRWVGASHELGWKDKIPYSVHETFSLQPVSVLGIFIEGIYSHSNPFVGVTVFLIALSGVALAWKKLAVRILLGLAAGGLLFAFSGFTLLHGIVYSLLPFVEKARNDAMAVFIFHLGICTLSAFGFDAVLDSGVLRSPWMKRITVACTGLALLLWLYLFGVYAAKLPSEVRPASAALTGIAAVLILCILRAARPSADGPALQMRTAGVLLIGVMMLEVGPLAFRDLSNRDVEQKFWSSLYRDADIARFLKSRPSKFRVDVNSDDVPYNFGDWYGIETYWGYLASAPVSLMRIMGEARTKELLGVQYYVAKVSGRGAGRELIASPTSGLKVFEMPNAMPRAWVVHEVVNLPKPDYISPRISDQAFPLAQSSFLLNQNPPPLETCSGDSANVKFEDPEYIVVDVKMNCRGMVIVGDSYSKDWVASVDGKRVPLYAAYTIVDGVVADAGQHKIELRYRPMSFYLGASLSVLSLLVILAIWRFTRRRESTYASLTEPVGNR